MHQTKRRDFMKENNLNEYSLIDYFLDKKQEAYYEDDYNYYEDFELKGMCTYGIDKSLLKKTYRYKIHMKSIKQSIEDAKEGLNQTALQFNDSSCFDFMYQVENPNRFYAYLCGFNYEEYQNECHKTFQLQFL